MSDIDVREFSQSQTLPEAVFRRTGPHASHSHTEAVNKISSFKPEGEEAPPTSEQLLVKHEEVPSLDMLKLTIQQKIDGDKSTGVITRNAEQTRRVSQADAAAELAVQVLETGYHNLTPGQKRQVQERVLPAMMRLWPELNTAFGPMNRSDRLKAMSDILNDPKFHQYLREAVIEVQNEDTGKVEKGDLKGKETTKEDLERQVKQKQDELAKIVNHVHEFDAGRPKGIELSRITTPMSQLKAEVETYSTQLETYKEELQRVNSDLARLSPYYSVTTANEKEKSLGEAARDPSTGLPYLRGRKPYLEGEITRLYGQLATKKTEYARKEELVKEKEDAEKDEERVDHELDDVKHRFEEAEKEWLTAQADVTLSKLEKAAKEQKFVDDLQHVFSKAAERVVADRMTKADAARKHFLESLPQEGLEHGKHHRWISKEGLLNKALIKSDYQRLLNGDQEGITLDMLVASGMERSAAEHLMQDEAFAKKAEDEATKELLTRYLQSGGKLKPKELKRLVNSHVGENIILGALEENKNIQKELDHLDHELNQTEAAEAGHATTVHGESRRERLREIVKSLPLPTKDQLFTAALIGAAGFFAGPAIIDIVLPHVHRAAARWVVEAHRHKSIAKIGQAAKAAPHTIARGIDKVEDTIEDKVL